jgi:DNA/RNA endonuclease G (NUC1)
VYIFTGVLFESPEVERIGLGQVAVPSHTFKVVLALRGFQTKEMYAVVVPNDPALACRPFASFVTSVDEVERRAGLDFFAGLEDQEEDYLESAIRGVIEWR